MREHSFQQKEALVRFLLHKRASILANEKMELHENTGEYINDKQLLNYLNFAYYSCGCESRKILEYEFIHPAEKNWWYQYYSKSTYYRMKHKAMDEFLHCLER